MPASSNTVRFSWSDQEWAEWQASHPTAASAQWSPAQWDRWYWRGYIGGKGPNASAATDLSGAADIQYTTAESATGGEPLIIRRVAWRPTTAESAPPTAGEIPPLVRDYITKHRKKLKGELRLAEDRFTRAIVENNSNTDLEGDPSRPHEAVPKAFRHGLPAQVNLGKGRRHRSPCGHDPRGSRQKQ